MTLELTAAGWQAFLEQRPEAHLLQTAAWGELKAQFGWSVIRVARGDAGAQVLFRQLPLGLTLAYVPKGPVGNWSSDFLAVLDEICRRQRAFALILEPDAEDEPAWTRRLAALGLRESRHGIQPRRTLLVSLGRDDEELLARMGQKTRYNIHLAERKGVAVRPWDDLAGFGRMMAETGARDRFGVHSPRYYCAAYEAFHSAGECELLVAEAGGRPLAALMAFARGSRAWYLYGASLSRERNLMPTYLLQWEAMRWARRRGCSTYDLWGVPDADAEVLEAGFASRQDGLWGVYRFKRGFGGRLVRSAGAWERAYIPLLYRPYRALTARRSYD